MAFQDLLDKLNEETDRGQLSQLAAKYPVLRNYAESGEMFETTIRPKLAEINPGLAKDPMLAVNGLKQWEGWKAEHWDKEHGMTRQQHATAVALEEAQARIIELEARSDTDMTPEEIKLVAREVAKEMNLVSSTELEARLAKAVSAATKEGEEPGEVYKLVANVNNNTALRFQNVYSALERKAAEHRRLFGEELDREAVFNYMQENKVWDANDAYQRMNKTRLDEKSAADKAAELEQAKQAGIEEGKRLAMAASGTRSNPVDGKGGNAIGFAESRAMSRRKPKEGETFRPRLGHGIGQQHMQERREAALAGAAE